MSSALATFGSGLILTLALMSIGPLSMACVPGYQSLGILAPILIAAARFLQGTRSPDAFDNKVIATTPRRQSASLEENTFLPVQPRRSRSAYKFKRNQPRARSTALGFIPGHAVGLVSVNGLTNFPGGLGVVGEDDFQFTSYQAYADASSIKNTYSTKFGVNVERI